MVLCFCNYASWTPAACPDRPSRRRPNPRHLRRPPLAHDRPLPRRPHRRRRRHPRPAQRLLHRRQQRRRLEDRRLRPHLEAPSSTTSPPAPSAPSPSRPPTRTSSTSAAAKACSVPISPSATACTKSTDAGKTWRHLGLRDGQQIPAIIVDPRDPDRLFVAVLGHPYGPNPERGVFRSTDGGQTWQKVLYKDENTGAIDLAFDPAQSPDRLRRPVGGATGTLGKRRLLRPQQRPLQIHRRRQHLEPAHRRPAHLRPGASAASASPSRPATRQSHVRPGRSPRRSSAASTAPTMPAPPGAASTASTRLRPRQRFRLRARRPQNRDISLRRQHLHLPLHRCRPHLHRHQRRARRRRLPHHLDQSRQPRHHSPRRRPGRHHHRQRRPDLELLVQPAHRAVLSRHHRQSDSLLGLRRAAGKRLRRHRQPRQRWRDHLPRLASRGRRGIRLHRARSAPSQYRLRRPRSRSFDRLTGEVEARRAASGSYRYLRTAPLLFSPVDPHILYLGAQIVLKTTDGGRSWQTISPDLCARNLRCCPPA